MSKEDTSEEFKELEKSEEFKEFTEFRKKLYPLMDEEAVLAEFEEYKEFKKQLADLIVFYKEFKKQLDPPMDEKVALAKFEEYKYEKKLKALTTKKETEARKALANAIASGSTQAFIKLALKNAKNDAKKELDMTIARDLKMAASAATMNQRLEDEEKTRILFKNSPFPNNNSFGMGGRNYKTGTKRRSTKRRNTKRKSIKRRSIKKRR